MAGLTNHGLYEYALEKRDVSRNPYQSETDFARRYTEARLQWMKLKFKDFEVTEQVSEDLIPFVREKDFGTNKILNYSELAPDELLWIIALKGNYSFSCNMIVTERTLGIAKRSMNEINASWTDPFNQPDDTEPVYTQKARTSQNGERSEAYLEIYSQSTPANVTLEYIKKPKAFDPVDDADGFTEEGELQQYEILYFVINDYEVTVENYQRFQATNQVMTKKAI